MKKNYCVITISLNSEATIAQTIDSVLSQSVLPESYIFVDGGSDDATIDIIRQKTQKLESAGVEIILLHQQPKPSAAGIPDAWNLGLARARADIVFILNSDDWYEDTDLASIVLERFCANQIDLLIGTTKLYYPTRRASKKVLNKNTLLFPFLNPFNHPATFVDRFVYEKIGSFDDSYRVSADYDFLYRCFKARLDIESTSSVCVSRLDGGFAVLNKELARKETYQIGRRHSLLGFFPGLAYLARMILNR